MSRILDNSLVTDVVYKTNFKIIIVATIYTESQNNFLCDLFIILGLVVYYELVIYLLMYRIQLNNGT